MSWSPEQRRRLAVEKRLIESRMPNFSLRNPTGDTYLEGWQGTSRGSRTYKLKVVVPPDFPWDMPELYIVSPNPLRTSDGYGTINEEGLSHQFHTLENGPGGCVQVCHCKSSRWDSSKTLVSVLIKGAIWVESYGQYLATGRPMSDFLRTQD